jgi:hypothetical protein
VFLEFFTGFSNMIRFNLAMRTKILLARLTPHSILAHVDCGLSRYHLASIVSDLVVYISLDKFHNVAATASYHVGVLREKLGLS